MAHDSLPPSGQNRFAFGLTTENVEELRTILREDCHGEVSLEEAWSRAASLLALTQLLLEHDGHEAHQGKSDRLEHRPT